MTVDLQMMLDLRDLQVAMDVGKRAEMGWFDVEFTMYGCSYLQGETCYYRVSSEAGRIYDFIETGAQRQILPTQVVTMTQKCPVPEGMKDVIAQDVKKKLAQHMRKQFSAAFFYYLAETATLVTEDSGLELLQSVQDQVAGCFDSRKLCCYEGLVDELFNRGKIGVAHYQQMKNWLTEERKSMEDDFISKDVFEKTFHGIAYAAPTGLVYVDNAQKATIQRQKHGLERQGIFVSPIFSETYWYNYTLRLPTVHARFTDALHETFTPAKCAAIQQICQQNSRMSKAVFQERLEYVRVQFGSAAAETFCWYGCRWGLL